MWVWVKRKPRANRAGGRDHTRGELLGTGGEAEREENGCDSHEGLMAEDGPFCGDPADR